MLARSAKNFFASMLDEAGIEIGKDIVVHDERMWADWFTGGMLGIGESFMAGQWTSPDIEETLTKLMRLPSATKRRMFKSNDARFAHMAQRLFNYQSSARSGIVGSEHYDLGNDFFASWLDSNMQYSCAYWKDPKSDGNVATLEDAQVNKLTLIANKLKLEPGMRVLEIGCGWGGLAVFLAKNYGVHVTGITISNEQLKGAREWAEREGVSDLTSFEYRDYREQTGEFDRVVSIAMLEAVGYKNMDEYYDIIKRCLKNGGLALVHSIGANRSTKTASQVWITKYIFPNGFLPSLAQMCHFAEKKFVVEDVHNLSVDYSNTLLCWLENFNARVEDGTVDRPLGFVRMWQFYLSYCSAGFRARTIQLYQQVLSKHRYERYDAPR